MEADKLLQQRINQDTIQISSVLKVPISKNALAALLSFNYNLGFGVTTKLISDINQGKSLQEVATRLKQYVYAGGVVSPGLTSRRKKEAEILIS